MNRSLKEHTDILTEVAGTKVWAGQQGFLGAGQQVHFGSVNRFFICRAEVSNIWDFSNCLGAHQKVFRVRQHILH